MLIPDKAKATAGRAFGFRGLSPVPSRPRYALSPNRDVDPGNADRIAYYRRERDKQLAACDRIESGAEQHFDHAHDPPVDTSADVQRGYRHMAEMMEHMARAYEGW